MQALLEQTPAWWRPHAHSCASAEGLPGNVCSAGEESVSVLGKDAPRVAERSGKGDASSPERQSPAGPRGLGTCALPPGLRGQHGPWTPARGAPPAREPEPGRLWLLSAFSEAVITLDFKQLPESWPRPGTYRVLELQLSNLLGARWASHAPNPQALLSLGRDGVWGYASRSHFKLVRVEKPCPGARLFQ